jgi:hypothetical protein
MTCRDVAQDLLLTRRETHGPIGAGGLP